MRSTAARTSWIVGAVACLLVSVAVVSVWTGSCVDGANGDGRCVYEPAIGGPQSVVVVVLGLGAAAICVTKAIRGGRRHGDGPRAGRR
ncbi:MAG: hypothetical protein PGN24_08535 [Microbacterium arborescens]